jgi:S1-C subfamily serine protease
MLVMVVAGCGPIESVQTIESTAPALEPAQRAVRIETTGCGYASDRTGSGVVIGDGLVLTVAHLIARADTVAASVGDGDALGALVTAVDLNRDLALLQLPLNGVHNIEMASAGQGARGLIVGGAASGTIPFEVKTVVSLSIEEVLGNDLHSRLGYELEAETAPGDSGAGAYDGASRLIGIVFATGKDGESSWVTASVEIENFLASGDPSAGSTRCTTAEDPADDSES